MVVDPGRRGRRSRLRSPQPGSGGVALAALLSAAFVITIGFGAPPGRDLPSGSRPLAVAASCPATVEPGDVEVGLRDVTVRFAVRSTRCDVTGWSLDWPAAGVQASDDVPAATVHAAGLRDADAGRTRLSATLGLADASPGRASMHAILRHRSTWGSSVRVVPGGRGPSLRGTLGRAWWDGGRYVGLPGQRVRVLFRTPGAPSFSAVAAALTGRGGRISVRLPHGRACRAGVWRLEYAGDLTNGPASASAPSP